MPSDLPAPPLPNTVDLRVFPYMPLDVVRLRDSELAVMTKGDEFRCAVLLWCAAWHQVPAASLPDDDALLSQLAGFGRVVKEWRRVKAGALRGFVKCSDGRLYHQVVATKALEAWKTRLEHLWRTECARLKKRAQRTKEDVALPDFDLWISCLYPESAPYLSPDKGATVPEDKAPEDQGQASMSLGKSHPRKQKEREIDSNNHPKGASSSGPQATATAVGEDQPPDPAMLARIVAECQRARMLEATAENPLILRWARRGALPAQVAAALAEARRPGCKPAPEDLPAAYVEAILAKIVKTDRAARAAVEARVQATARATAEIKAAKTTAVPPPADLVEQQRRKAAADA